MKTTDENKQNLPDRKPVPAGLKGLKQEFKKIKWPGKKTVASEVLFVAVTAAVICLIIVLADSLIGGGIARLYALK